MGRKWTVYLLAGLAVSVGGCATAINMQDAAMRKPYGGLTMPLDDFYGGSEAGEYVVVRFWPIWLLDKPLSLFGDTITLPYMLWIQRGRKDANPAKQPAEAFVSPSAAAWSKPGGSPQ